MKILVVSGAAYGDPARRGVFDHVARSGVEVTLAMPRVVHHPFLPPGEVPDTPRPTPGVRLVRLDLRREHPNDTHIIARGLGSLVREVEPDLIHCALEPWSIMCLQVLAAIRSSRPRPVFGVQAGETKPEQGGPAVRFIRQALYRRVLSRCDFFIGWSSPVIRAATRMGLNGQVTCVAPGVGIDPEEFRPLDAAERIQARRELGWAEAGMFIVTYAGRMVEEKGVFDLLQAMEKVSAARPGARLLMVGDGPALDAIRAAATSRPWLRLLRSRGRSEIARILGAVDLFVLASRTTSFGEEQFGMVLAESMSTGVPVIGSSCGAIPEVVGDGGWIFPEGDAESLAREIIHAIDSPDELNRKSLAARARARTQFSDESVAERMIRTWRQAAAGAGA